MKKSKFYTNRKYYSKQDLINDFGDNAKVKTIWNEVEEYRKIYSYTLPAAYNSSKKLFIVQTPVILQKEINLLNKVNNFYRIFINAIGEKYNTKIINEEIQNLGFFEDLKYVAKNRMNIDVPNFTIENIIFDGFIGEEENEIATQKIYNLMKVFAIKYEGLNYLTKELFPNIITKDKINLIDTNINNAIEYENLNSYVTKSAIIYFIIWQQIKDEKYDIITMLLIQSYLFKTSFSALVSTARFSALFNSWISRFEEACTNVEKYSGDITYLYLIFMEFFQELVQHTTYETINFTNDKNLSNVVITRRTKNLDFNKLLKMFPDLSAKQARFYVQHKTKGAYYTVNDFKTKMQTSYETARYSMEKLEDLGLYEKRKIGKKYVYKAK